MPTDFSSRETSHTYSEGVIAEALTLKPVILSLIQNVRDKNVIDFGCGDGRYSIILAESGAHVTAIDASEHQIATAEKTNKHANIHYMHGNAADLSNISTGSIDVALMNMVVPDLESPKQMEEVIAGLAKAMRKRGTLILSTLHPLYLSPDQDPSDKAVDFEPKRYFDEGHTYKAEAITAQGNIMEFNETHMSMSYLTDILFRNKFLIKRILESKAVPEKGMYLPKYLILDCIAPRD